MTIVEAKLKHFFRMDEPSRKRKEAVDCRAEYLQLVASLMTCSKFEGCQRPTSQARVQDETEKKVGRNPDARSEGAEDIECEEAHS